MPAARIQPQGRARINRANPLARGLAHAWGVNTLGNRRLRDAAGAADGAFGVGVPSTFSGNIWTPGPTGYFVLFDNSGTGAFASTALAVGSSAGSGSPGSNIFSIQARVRFASIGSIQTIYGGGLNNAIQFRISASGNLQLIKSNVVGLGTDTFALSAGVDYDIGVDYDGQNVRFYVNGVATGTASSAQTFDLTQQHFLGAKVIPGSATDEQIGNGSRIYYANVWNRSRTASEFRAVAASPWQLYEGQPAMLTAAAAPAGSNATASPSGVSASSAVGSATGIGQAKAAPAGVAASAAVGTATASGSTVISGTASPAGISAAASVGSATVSGQGRVTPAGVSAVASVGSATASGAASSTAQPAGVASVASVGAAVASGQGKALPPGVGASASVGAALASGTAITTAYPAGVSSVASVGIAAATGRATAAPLGVASSIIVGTAYAYGPLDVSSLPKVYATTLMRVSVVNRSGGVLSAAIAKQSAMRATQACSTLMRAQPINLTSAMRSDPINRTAGLL